MEDELDSANDVTVYKSPVDTNEGHGYVRMETPAEHVTNMTTGEITRTAARSCRTRKRSDADNIGVADIVFDNLDTLLHH